ncbi:MAG: hypothetical protein JO002_11875 [Burkholderiaceae bacterium]|nr:hypothetical protein [Burkholderiaceae bacterium]
MTRTSAEPAKRLSSIGMIAAATLPGTAQLLTEGGDARIELDAITGLNKYGCAPLPDPGMIALGSSTASIISERSYDAAEGLRMRLLASGAASDYAAYASEMNRTRCELLSLCGISEGSGVDVVFAASGTDIHLIAAQAFSSGEKLQPLVIMVEANETGSGVAAALAGRHFSSHSAMGETVTSGANIRHAAAIEVVSVALRDANGMARSDAAIDADFVALATPAAEAGRRVLLILIDGSKTGAIAPTADCVLQLQQRYPDRIDVMVDACQFRIAPQTLRAYLQRDFMVALTGSKFATGPTFCGALMIPPLCARRMRRHPIPPALRAYSSRGDWPADWDSAAPLDQIANFGLLLRWEAALAEIRAFRSLSDEQIAGFLRAFGAAVQDKLQRSPLLDPLPLPSLERGSLAEADNWDHIPSIHPFLLFYPNVAKGRSALDRDQTQRVYQLLQADLSTRKMFGSDSTIGRIVAQRCQLGQPVACGHRDGVPVSALRVCASMRMIARASADGGREMGSVIEQTISAIEKAELLAHTFARV